MEVEVPNSERPGGVSFSMDRERPALKIHSDEQTGCVEVVKLRELSMPDAKEVARVEMVRRRKRLGELTRDQEIAIENLLMSTVNRISELVGRALEA